MVHFFCHRGRVDSREVCRVIVQSQIQVFRAMRESVREETRVGQTALGWVSTLRGSMKAVRELEHFVLEARKIGLLAATDIESLLQPLHDHMEKLERQFHRAFDGEAVQEDEEGEDDEEKDASSSEESIDGPGQADKLQLEELEEVELPPEPHSPGGTPAPTGVQLSVLPGEPEHG
mmetsp:Transcript_121179/g.170445  ORF Transcript_121179/g.170445 Transcript_121179/m.170445 type:complete len:176 (+) Transcript_121179:1-528(+)